MHAVHCQNYIGNEGCVTCVTFFKKLIKSSLTDDSDTAIAKEFALIKMKGKMS